MWRNNFFSHKRLDVLIALSFALLGVLLLQFSALSYDYMKLMKIPLYGNSQSVGLFAYRFHEARLAINNGNAQISKIISRRQTIDLDVFEAKRQVELSIYNARNAIREDQNKNASSQINLLPDEINFATTEKFFQDNCFTDDNQIGNKLAISQIAESDVKSAQEITQTIVNSANEPKQEPENKKSKSISMKKSLSPKICEVNNCGDSFENEIDASARAKMICAQIKFNEIDMLKRMASGFTFDANNAFADQLRLFYPEILPADVPLAIRVADNYDSMTNFARICSNSGLKNNIYSNGDNYLCENYKSIFFGGVPTSIFNAILGVPLFAMYLTLAFIFGGQSYLVANSYIFRRRVGDIDEDNSYHSIEKIVVGGAAASLILVVVAVISNTFAISEIKDITYPTPLAVCALSVLVGLNAESALKFLRKISSRIINQDESVVKREEDGDVNTDKRDNSISSDKKKVGNPREDVATDKNETPSKNGV